MYFISFLKTVCGSGWHSYSWKTGACSPYLVNTMAVDELDNTRSHAIDLVILGYIPATLPEGLNEHQPVMCCQIIYNCCCNCRFEFHQIKCWQKSLLSREMWMDIFCTLCVHHCGTVAAESQNVICWVSATIMMTKFWSFVYIYLYLSFHMRKDLQYNSSHDICGLSMELSSYPHGREEISFRTL